VIAKAMKKQFVIIGIIILLSSIELSGCEEQNITQVDKEKFIGTWQGNQVSDCCGSKNKTIIFNSSGNVDWGDSLPLTYRVDGDKLYIGYGELASGEDAYSYSFKNDYKTLTLSLLTPSSENGTGLIIYLNKV
jgi:hypothetical protein